mmetsp:Transcript_7578/g.21535  ORF Transcript_7578/g.21535 Transcript_7578/m.21535 type:complete len:271 (+) Transcript_7578:41-853(+)
MASVPVWELDQSCSTRVVPEGKWDKCVYYIEELAKYTKELQVIVDNAESGRKPDSNCLARLRIIRDGANDARRQCSSILKEKPSAADKAKHGKLASQFESALDKYTVLAQKSLRLERVLRDQVEAERSRIVASHMHDSDDSSVGESTDSSSGGGGRLQMKKSNMSRKDRTTDLKFGLEEIENLDEALVDELNQDIAECAKDVEAMLECLGDMKVHVEETGRKVDDIEEELEAVECDLGEAIDELEEIPCRCCRSCCACCSCWNSCMCTIS